VAKIPKQFPLELEENPQHLGDGEDDLAMSFRTRALLAADQMLASLRGVYFCMYLSSSTRFTTESIQPKQSASSRASS